MIRDELINRGIDYIIEHLNEDISIEDVAKHCNYSKYHFSRKFKEETGESLYAFIKRMKMNQSAVKLQLEKEKSITDIGLDYGYESTNFSAVFKKQHDAPPTKYRKITADTYFPSPFYQDGLYQFQSFEEYDKRIVIQKWDTCKVIYERCVGNYIEIKDKWKTFLEKYNDYIQEDTLFIERYYDDPSITELNKCVYDMCITANQNCPLENVTSIQQGRYAVYLYKGAVEEIYNAVQGMFHSWLPNSRYEMSGSYSLNRYHVMDSNNMYVEMDICIPIKDSNNS